MEELFSSLSLTSLLSEKMRDQRETMGSKEGGKGYL